MLIVWVIVFVITLILEIMSMYLISIWFLFGSVGAIVAYALGASKAVQFIVFAVLSIVLLIFTRPFIRKMFPSGYIPTNSELDIGKQVIVTETIDNSKNTGRVQINGAYWGAKSINGSIINEGESVIVKQKGTTSVTVERVATQSD